MASYHFELRSDKKPNGVQINAGSHISYINRAGKFQDIDMRTELRADAHDYHSTISGTHSILSLPKNPVLLYSSPFGKIKLDAQGIHVTKNASPKTVGIALAAARRIFGGELSLLGTEVFQKSARITARGNRSVERTADAILEILQKETDSKLASAHLQYINRAAAASPQDINCRSGQRIPR